MKLRLEIKDPLLLLVLFYFYQLSAANRNQSQQQNQRGRQIENKQTTGPSGPFSDNEPQILREPGASTLTPDPNAPPGTSSLTFVFDVTGSMYDDLMQVREGAQRIFATVLEQREKLIYSYVLVPFHDPEVGPVVVTTDTQYFQRKLQNLYVQGGGDCPEMAISGVKLALEASLPSSFIYVFTDARAKDYHLTDQVLNLIQEKQSQVVFVMTGDCGNRSHPGYKAFERIASTSSGQVFHLEKSDVNEVLNYVRVAVQTRKVHVASVDRDGPGSYVIDIPVDSYLHEFTVSLSGDEPEIQLHDSAGDLFRESSEVKPILDLGNAIIYNVRNPKPGVWKLRTTARSKHSVRVTGLGEIATTHGFAPRILDDVNRAHYRPLQGVVTYCMVNMTGLPPPGAVNRIDLIDLAGNTLYKGQAIMDKKNPFLYHVGPFMPPDGYYFVKVNGVDDRNVEFQRISLTAINPQPATGPKVFMAMRTVAFYGQSTNVTCNIESRTPFTLFWFRGSEKIGGPFYFKYSDTAFWTITDVSSADTGEYRCTVTSLAGNDSASTFLEAKDPPPHIIAPKNVTATLGATAQLHCRTQSPGPATITWQRKGIPIQSSAQFSVFPNGTLNISPISKNDEGGYVCHVITPGGAARAEIYIAVLEAPKVNIYPSSLFFLDRGSFNLSCTVSGDPPPETQWYLRNELIQPSGKHYVSYKHDLIVRGAAKEDEGEYECRATSPSGVANDYATVRLAEVPQVYVARETETIGRGDSVTLECKVSSGAPPPTITWYKAGREVTAFRYINVENGQLTIQGAQDADAGIYSCVAENMAGRAEGRIRVDVGSAPSIVPSPDTATVNIERDVTLQCRATGHPTPEIAWAKDGVPVGVDARHVVLPDGGLLIRGSSLEDVGRYICTATNRFGKQDAVRTLTVSGLVAPVLGHVSPDEQVAEGNSLRLSCVVILGTPKPSLRWFKDRRPLSSGGNIQILGEGSSLAISNVGMADEGQYTCSAANAAGNASIHVNVNVITKPRVSIDSIDVTVKQGERLEVPCKVKGRPTPTVTWSKDGRPLLQQSADYALRSDGTLVIYRTQSSDTGIYQCTASNSAGEDSRTVRVTVRVAPKITPDQPSYNAKVGERIIITCDVAGEPRPTIVWTLNGRPVVFDHNIQQRPNGSLMINHVKEEHRGEFRCQARNDVGMDSRNAIVNVHTAPVIAGSGEVRTITARVNETVRFQCPARADPPPTREWTFEGRKIYESFIRGSELRFPSDDTLEIVAVQIQGAGRYACQVSNVAGNDSISYILKVDEPPRIVSEVQSSINVVLGSRLDMPCRAVGTPLPTISWQKDGFHILSGGEHMIERDGTLRIGRAKLEHAGRYTCTAKNTVGVDSRVVDVIVQEPPQISSSTLTSYTAIDGQQLQLRCVATGSPKPEFHWFRHGVQIRDESGIGMYPDGLLIVESARDRDHGAYLCRAVNPAGEASQDIMVTVISPPVIPDHGVIATEEVLLGSPFTLYCPVSSTPVPEIMWHMQDKPVVETDSNIQISEDKRRLHILKARVVDSGLYKCIARNAAGQSSKVFRVEVLVPPYLEESKQQLKVTVISNQSVSISCPVAAIPEPTMNWMFNGQLLESGGPLIKGIRVTENGEQVRIASSQLDHEGTYTCVATNKAGSLDADIILSVLAPPQLGRDESFEVTNGSIVTMNCNPKEDGLKSTITWIKGEQQAESSGENIQIALEGRKLYVNRADISNEGTYVCIVRNIAGETRKTFQLRVLVPPKFRDKQYEQTVYVPEGQSTALTCHVTGNPTPEVLWDKDGQVISPNSINGYEISEDGRTFKIREMYKKFSARFTCLAKNKAGGVSRDFFVQSIARPVIFGGERIQLEAMRGSALVMDCPVVSTDGVKMEWLKDAKNLPVNLVNYQLSGDQQRLRVSNVQEEDEGLYVCTAQNAAGTASQEFQLTVLASPVILGSEVEEIEVIEGHPLTMRCQFEADPLPRVSWLKDGSGLPPTAQILSDNVTMYVNPVAKSDAGIYFCTVENKAGSAEKTFNVRVVGKPMINANNDKITEVILGHPISLDCPVRGGQDVEVEWLQDNRPLNKTDMNFQTRTGGRYLHIGSARRTDSGIFTCVAKNKAGSSARRINLMVLVPPRIKGAGGEHVAIQDQSLTLPCDVDAVPQATITWTKRGEDVTRFPNVQLLSSGQQLRISSISQSHSGQYICTATNKAGSADLSFDVDVIAPPSIAEHAKDTVEVLLNHSTTLRCPVNNGRYSHSIIWLKDQRSLATRGNSKFIESQNGRKLHLSNAQFADEGIYSCKVKNRAGETTIDFKVIVLELPKVLILDKDKNQSAVENSTLTLSCPVSGKPDPEIRWYKEGEQLTLANLGQRVPGGEMVGNTLQIQRIRVEDSGRYTCIAQNKAGIAEQDISVYVMTPPRIHRGGIPSTIQAILQQRATISCPVYGRPTPTVTWLKAGRPIEANDEVYYSASMQKLHFVSLRKSDLDLYTCIAKNPAGEDKRDFNLDVLIAPSIAGMNLPRHLQAIIGRSALLECPAVGSPDPAIAWMKNGQPISEGDRISILNGGRQLQITNSQLDDTARYNCIASNAIGVVDLDTYVDVVGPPSIDGQDVQLVEVIEAQASTLTCDIVGTEPLDIEWLKNGQSLNSEGSKETYIQVAGNGRRLHILAAQTTDEGRYVCVGRNRAGEARKTFDLRVFIPATINDTLSSPSVQRGTIGHPFRIECKAFGNPRPQVTWFKDGAPFQPNPDDSLVKILYDNQTIWFARLADAHGGRYTCLAMNQVGSAEKDFILQLKGPPQVDQPLVSKEVLAGDYVMLTCAITGGEDGLEIRWSFDEKPLEALNDANVKVEDKRLEIRKARLTDSGRYSCTAKNEAGEARKNFDLVVLEPPHFVDTINLTPSIVEGRPLLLDCSVRGTPKATVKWLKDGVELSGLDGDAQFINDNQQYRVAIAGQRDAGRYMCVAENKAGRAEKDLIVDIQMPPKMRQGHSAAVEVAENETTTLDCPVEGANVQVHWNRNGLPIALDYHIQLSASGRKLHFIKAQTKNAGRYTCIGRNEAGQASTDIDVVVLVPPIIHGPGFRTLEGVMNQSLQIDCRVSGSPEPKIEWTKDGRPLTWGSNVEVIQNGTFLQLQNIQATQEGRYTCVAVNKIGRMEADTFLQVIAPPSIEKNPSEAKVLLNQNQIIRCEVSGNPTPVVAWLKNGQPLDSALVHSSARNHYVHIVEAKLADAGRYTCVAKSRAGEDRHTTTLHVLVPPTILAGDRILNVIENRSLTIECMADGTPEPTMRWYKDGRLLSPPLIERNAGGHRLRHHQRRHGYGKNYHISGNRLTISHAQVSDAGRYTCEAESEGAGTSSVDFAVDVYTRPHFVDLVNEIKVVEGERATLDCKVEAKPPAQLTWLRAGRRLDQTSTNFIFSPRGHRLIILSTKRSDAGTYSCIAKNAAGENEANIAVTILVSPYLASPVDQNPKLIFKQNATISCPVAGNPPPKVEWKKEGVSFDQLVSDRLTMDAETHALVIYNVQVVDKGRYTCHASNEAGILDTDFVVDVNAPPKFAKPPLTEYEVIQGQSITLDCQAEAYPKPEIVWLKGDNAVYLDRSVWLSADAQQLTISSARPSDGGRYTCRATNIAGTTDVDLILHVLIPPSIDKSNIIGNPLAIVNKSISLECPATGIPAPSVTWTKDGHLLPRDDDRISLAYNNQTLKIDFVLASDAGRYTCVAVNRAGRMEQDFTLEVLTPPVLDAPTPIEHHTLTEKDSLTLICPVVISGTQTIDISWTKDGRPLDSSTSAHTKISSDNRRLHIASSKLSDSGVYNCVASNRAGESQMEFRVEMLLEPNVDGSRNDPQPRVIEDQSQTLWCLASGRPRPTITWLKDGVPINATQNTRYTLIERGQGLRIEKADSSDAGRYTCVVKNAAGKKELDLLLTVWTAPTVSVESDRTVIALGQSVTLTCRATGNPQPQTQWSKGGQTIISSASGARISEDGYQLHIPRVKIDDAGRYACTARNEAGSAEDYEEIDILLPPSIRRVDSFQLNPSVPLGQTLTMMCEADGRPIPQITWYKDGVPISPSDKVTIAPGGVYMQVHDVGLEDKGLYRCQAVNDAGDDHLVYNVDVYQSPVIGPGGIIQVIENQTAVMECDTRAVPPPIVHWQRNGHRVVSKDRYQVHNKTLQISLATSADAGIYVCVSSNEIDIAQQAYTLEVLVPPRISPKATDAMTVPLGNAFELKCAAHGYPTPQIVWYKGSRSLEPNDKYVLQTDGTLVVADSSPDDDDPYRCIATNAAGKDEHVHKVIVIKPPKIAGSEVRVVNVSQGESLLLVCEVQADPLPHIVWNKEGSPIFGGPQTSRLVFEEQSIRMRLSDSRLTDSGSYSCEADNSAGNASQRFVVYVGVAPKITDDVRRIVVANGSRTDVPCEAVGHPSPSIEWLFNGQSPISEGHLRGNSVVFPKVRPQDAGTYTCKATNWVSSATKDVELIVLNRPQILPEQLNITVRENGTAVFRCNATGATSPVSWFKEPNFPIVNNNKFAIVNDTLRIRNVKKEDAGYYRCVGKNEAGAGVGHRRLTVDIPRPQRIVWIPCDDKGKPVRESYVPARGDTPSTQQQWLPWSSESAEFPENGTDGMILKCLPSEHRKQRHQNPVPQKPMLVELPRNQDIREGQTLTLTCGAIGLPPPEVLWLHNQTLLSNYSTMLRGRSILKINRAQSIHAGTYMCLAKNQLGSTRAAATVKIRESTRYLQTEGGRNQQMTVVSILTCQVPPQALSKVRWMRDGYPVESDNNRIHVMENGTLVLTGFEENEMKQYKCLYGQNYIGTVVAEKAIHERQPVVTISPRQYEIEVGGTIRFHCQLVEGDPLTTQIVWYHNRQPLMNSDRAKTLSGNSLLVTSVTSDNRGEYRCVASNTKGSSHAAANVIISGSKYEAKSRLSGELDSVRFVGAPIQYSLSNRGRESEIRVHVEALPLNFSSGSRAVLGLASTPCWLMAVRSKQGADLNQLTGGRFQQESHYEFDTGETVDVRNVGHGVNGGFLIMETMINGRLPSALQNRQEAISMEPYVENVIQSAPGKLYGYGSNSIRVGSADSIPLRWRHNITFDAKGKDLPYSSERIRVYDINLNGDGLHSNYSISVRAASEAVRQCPVGFTTSADEIYCSDLDECKTRVVDCEESQECVNSIGSYRCLEKCANGFARSEGGQCTDVDECILLTQICSNACQFGCFNYPGAFYCHCPPGFVRSRLPSLPPLASFNKYWLFTVDAVLVDARVCSDIDECKTGVAACRPGEECVNIAGGYWCKEPCQGGYRRNDQGICVDVDECREIIPCHPDQTCINLPGSFKCLCPAGLVSEGPRQPCKDIDECVVRPPVCSHGCRNTRGSYECICPSGFVLTSNGRTCNAIDFGLDGPRALDQGDAGFKTLLSRSSDCPEGAVWNGETCEDLGAKCELACEYRCRRTYDGSQVCVCPMGYRLSSSGHSCIDIDECQERLVNCSADSMCFNERGSYSCLRIACPSPYKLSTATSSCLLACANSSYQTCNLHRPSRIKIETVSLPNGVPPFRDILRLTAFDGKGRQLRRTHFFMSAADDLQDEGQYPPFAIRLVQGSGTLFTVKKLTEERLYKLKVRAMSYDEFLPNTKYQTEFLIFVSVSRFPF